MAREPGVQAFSKGGGVKPMAVVGERGPELVRLPVGSRVYSHGRSKHMARRMGIQSFATGGLVRQSVGGLTRKQPVTIREAVQDLITPQTRITDRAYLERDVVRELRKIGREKLLERIAVSIGTSRDEVAKALQKTTTTAKEPGIKGGKGQGQGGGGHGKGVGDSRKSPDLPQESVRSSSASGGLNQATRFLAEVMRKKFGLTITSGVRRQDSDSFHSQGKAVDVAGPKMFQAAQWVKTSGLYKTLLEGIHNPNLSTDSGRIVPSSFWGSGTWADHKDHIHLAAQNIATSIKQELDEKGGTGRRRPRAITGGSLSLGQLVTLSKRVGFPDPALAAAVAFAESKGRVRAVGDSGESIGLWQIHLPDHPRYERDDMFDAFKNARAALAISRRGRTWHPWSTYNDGTYKKFLGAKGKPLPGSGNLGGGDRTKYADYLELWLEEAEGTSREKREINKGLRYWRKVYRRTRHTNPTRALEALGHIKDLRERKVELRTPPEGSVFTLGDLTTIGKPPNVFNIAGLQGTIDQIKLDMANAALTERLGPTGSVTPDSYEDDLKAARHLVQVWSDIQKLANGFDMPRQIFNKKGELVKATTHYEGTRKQKTEAALELVNARDALKNIQEEMKSEDADTAAVSRGDSRLESQAFLSAIADLFKQFGPNFRPVPAFAKGGITKQPLALVGEKGPELVRLPVGSKVFSNQQSERITEKAGNIQAFATGGVVQSPKDANLEQTLRKIEEALKEPRIVNKNVDARSTFKEQPADPHGWSRNVAFEIEAAV